MKKVMNSFIAMIFFVFFVQAQQTFNGTVNYEIKAMGEGAEMMAAFLPTGYEYQFLGKDFLFRMEGGLANLMLGDILCKEGVIYMIKHEESTAYTIDDSEDEAVSNKNTVTKIDELITIAGYSCSKYKVVTNTEEGEVIQYMWVTKEINPDFDRSKSTGGVAFVKEVEGFPLKIMTETMGITMIMTATKVDKTKPDKANFSVPSSYEVKKFDPAVFGEY